MIKSLTLRRCGIALCLLTSALSCGAQSATSAAPGTSSYTSAQKPLMARLAAAKKACEATGGSRNKSRCQTRLNTKGGADQPVKAPWYFFSDERLKTDITLLESSHSGLGLYAYRYAWSDTVYVGVMAQEVAGLVPDAVAETEDGYLMVDYRRLGLELLTLEQWVAAQR